MGNKLDGLGRTGEKQMSCDCDNKKPAQEMLGKYKGHGIRESDYDIKRAAARDAVIEAAKEWVDLRKTDDGALAADLVGAVMALNKLEQPADPLEPVRDFVAMCQRIDLRYQITAVNEFLKKLEAAERALGMVKP
jgi:hypothetical protein